MAAPAHKLLKKNDQAIDVVLTNGLLDVVTYIADATVTVNILDPLGAVPTGGGPLSGTYQGSGGLYRALIAQNFDPTVGPGYQIKIVATTPAGGDGQWFRAAYVAEG